MIIWIRVTTIPSLLVLLVGQIALTFTLGFTHQSGPPILPKEFSIHFSEVQQYTYTHSGRIISKNNGSWFYDFSHNRARFDHGRGQLDDFCQHQNLSDHDPRAPCQLLFATTGDLFVHYPEQKNCCRLCGIKEGCTILKPDWLKNGHIFESEFINGLACDDWGTPGAVAAEDILLVTAEGQLCRYSEIVLSLSHNLTFIPGTYKIGAQDPALFNVPLYCNRICPRPFPSPGIHGSYPMFGGKI